MREILFRGKRKICDEWAYGFPFISRKGEYKIKWYDGYYGSSKTSEIYPESIGQFTGLTDKNGKKIFEGDIVRNGEYTMIVVWYDFLASFALAFSVDGNYHETMSKSDVYLEIIGNIHDNPELLENP